MSSRSMTIARGRVSCEEKPIVSGDNGNDDVVWWRNVGPWRTLFSTKTLTQMLWQCSAMTD